MVGLVMGIGFLGAFLSTAFFFGTKGTKEIYDRVLKTPQVDAKQIKADEQMYRVYGIIEAKKQRYTRMSKTPCIYSTLEITKSKPSKDKDGKTKTHKTTVLNLCEGGEAIITTKNGSIDLDFSTIPRTNNIKLVDGFSGPIGRDTLEKIRNDYHENSTQKNEITTALTGIFDTFTQISYYACEKYIPSSKKYTVYGKVAKNKDGNLHFVVMDRDFYIAEKTQEQIRDEMQKNAGTNQMLVYAIFIFLALGLVGFALGI